MLEQGERVFTVDSPVWRTVDAWASEYGYRLVEWHAMSRVYEKAHWILRGFGRWRVAIEENGHDVGFGARVRFRPLSPPGPGRDAFLHKARGEANTLLAALGQPPLEE